MVHGDGSHQLSLSLTTLNTCKTAGFHRILKQNHVFHIGHTELRRTVSCLDAASVRVFGCAPHRKMYRSFSPSSTKRMVFMSFQCQVSFPERLYPMTDPCMLYIYMVTWIPSIYLLYVSINIAAPWIRHGYWDIDSSQIPRVLVFRALTGALEQLPWLFQSFFPSQPRVFQGPTRRDPPFPWEAGAGRGWKSMGNLWEISMVNMAF